MQTPDDVLIVHIYDLLYQLGLKATHSGFFYLAHAILYAYKDPALLLSITKLLYSEVGDYYNTTWRCVEKNVRYALDFAWQEHPNRFCRTVGRHLFMRPAASLIISLMVSKIKKQ